jgi:hypothetical protein
MKNSRNGVKAPQQTVAAEDVELSTELDGRSSTEESDEERVINDGGIENVMALFHQLTISFVGNVSKTVVLDRYSWPQLADMHIWYSECYHLFRRALGFQEENLDSASRRLAVDLDDIAIYLRSLLVTDVYHTVLTKEFPDLPFFSLRWIEQTFNPAIKKCKLIHFFAVND